MAHLADVIDCELRCRKCDYSSTGDFARTLDELATALIPFELPYAVAIAGQLRQWPKTPPEPLPEPTADKPRPMCGYGYWCRACGCDCDSRAPEQCRHCT